MRTIEKRIAASLIALAPVPIDDYARKWAHKTAEVMVAQLGLREEEDADFTGGARVRYVTEWQPVT